MKNKLIILRGPSASGKTTIAKKLFDLSKDKTVLIQQDHYRFIFKPSGGGSKPNSEVIHKMIEHGVKVSLEAGYNVILEGIISVKSYQKIIERLIESHKGKSYIFYFNISLEETLKRHNSKIGDFKYGSEEMKEWYKTSQKSNHELETLIPETNSINQTIGEIIKTSDINI